MENTFKTHCTRVMGIIAIVAVIGFSMAACDIDGGNGAVLSGTYRGGVMDMFLLTFSAPNNYTLSSDDGNTADKGTYTINGSTITFKSSITSVEVIGTLSSDKNTIDATTAVGFLQSIWKKDAVGSGSSNKGSDDKGSNIDGGVSSGGSGGNQNESVDLPTIYKNTTWVNTGNDDDYYGYYSDNYYSKISFKTTSATIYRDEGNITDNVGIVYNVKSVGPNNAYTKQLGTNMSQIYLEKYNPSSGGGFASQTEAVYIFVKDDGTGLFIQHRGSGDYGITEQEWKKQ